VNERKAVNGVALQSACVRTRRI